MNTKLVLFAVASLTVVALAAIFGGSPSPNTASTTNPTTPAYVDSIVMDSVSFSNNTSATLQLQEVGNATATLTSYRVMDSGGNSYSLTGWSDQTILPSNVATVNVQIGNSCISCTLTGSSFMFSRSQTYSITVYASDGQQFSFQVTRRNSSYEVNLSVGFGATGNP